VGPYAPAEDGGHRDNSVGYPTFPFMPSVEHMPPSGAGGTDSGYRGSRGAIAGQA
jgi:hypothetical protein